MVPDQDQQGILIQQLNSTRQHLIHLLQFCFHSGVVWAYSMTDMIHPKEMSDEEVPWFAGVLEEREEVLNHP
jgi:hypothetical protein